MHCANNTSTCTVIITIQLALWSFLKANHKHEQNITEHYTVNVTNKVQLEGKHQDSKNLFARTILSVYKTYTDIDSHEKQNCAPVTLFPKLIFPQPLSQGFKLKSTTWLFISCHSYFICKQCSIISHSLLDHLDSTP